MADSCQQMAGFFHFKTDLDFRPVDGLDGEKNRPGPID